MYSACTVQLQVALTESQQPAAEQVHVQPLLGAALITHINEQSPSTREAKVKQPLTSSSPCYHDSLLTCVVRLESELNPHTCRLFSVINVHSNGWICQMSKSSGAGPNICDSSSLISKARRTHWCSATIRSGHCTLFPLKSNFRRVCVKHIWLK